MSINALEVLEKRLAGRVRKPMDIEDVGIPYYPEDSKYPPYHSPEYWDMMWQKHEAWREKMYPPPAGTVWGVTPTTGDG